MKIYVAYSNFGGRICASATREECEDRAYSLGYADDEFYTVEEWV